MGRRLLNTKPLLLFLIILSLSCGKDGNNPTSSGKKNDIEGITFVTIPAGSFRMGDIQNYGVYSHEKPVHDVSISSFQMSISEITQGQYKRIMGSVRASDALGKSDSISVYSVDWYDAVRFCNVLSDAADFERCYDESSWFCDFNKNGFRLPTEAEWEYACRAGTETMFYTGNNLSSDAKISTDLAEAGWYHGNNNYHTYPVGLKEPNAWGLYDMHGNESEWCNDWYSNSYYSSSSLNNPIGPSSGDRRVLRGGDWYSYAVACRSAARGSFRPLEKSYHWGFRVVRR